MSSTAKNILYSMTLLLLFPMSAFADIKIIIGAPAHQYKHHYSNSYSNKHHNKNNVYNKYNYAPYSYRSNHYNFADRNKKYYFPSHRHQPKQHYNRSYYNPYAYNINNNQYQNAYKQGFKDGRHQKKRSFKAAN